MQGKVGNEPLSPNLRGCRDDQFLLGRFSKHPVSKTVFLEQLLGPGNWGGGAATEDKEASGAMKESLGRTLLVNVWCPAAGWVGVGEGT